MLPALCASHSITRTSRPLVELEMSKNLMASVCPRALLALLVLATSATQAVEKKSAEWTEEALLHDGRTTTVTIYAEDTLSLQFWWPLPPVISTSLHKLSVFQLSFRHPDTQNYITWYGAEDLRPVLVDFVDGVPYLVIYGRPDKKSAKNFGCPELPYVYMKHHRWTGWDPIPVEEAPLELRQANLATIDVDYYYNGKNLSQAEVAKRIDLGERHTHHHFQARIPRTYDEWNIKGKNGERNERPVWDCRPPPQPLPDIPLPKPQDVELEVVESIEHWLTTPEQRRALNAIAKGSITRANCAELFTWADTENTMLGEAFVKDTTRGKRLPYSGPIPLPTGQMFERRYERYCDSEFIWFVARREEKDRTFITKYTISGDLIYNVRIVDPFTNTRGDYGMVEESFRSEDGFLTLYWIQNVPDYDNRFAHPALLTKFRIREPK
jgi:hypothetical protein